MEPSTELTDRQMATIFAALIAWEDELSEGERWLKAIYDFGDHMPLSKQEVRELRDQLRKGGHIPYERDAPAMWKMSVPTYLGAQPHQPDVRCSDFSEPRVPVLVHESAGVRVIMGTHDWQDGDKPDIQVERRPHGWAIFIHPNGGDPVACLYFLDDGRTFLMPEKYSDPPLETTDDIPAELDAP